MKILQSLKTCFAALTIGLVPFVSFTGCSDPPGGPNNDTAPATLDGLELFFIEGQRFSFQFAKIGGDAPAGGENGFSNSFEPGEDMNTTILNEFGTLADFEVTEEMTNIAYTYTKTGPNTGVILITAQSRSNAINNLDIFSDIAAGSDITFTIAITFGSAAGIIGEVALEMQDVPSDLGPLAYTLTTPVNGVEILTQAGDPVPVGYDEMDAKAVLKKTPARIYADKFSDLGQGVMSFDNIDMDTYSFIGVTSDDQGFGTDPLDQGVLGIDVTIGGVTTEHTTVPYAWYNVDNQSGVDDVAELHLHLPGGTEIFRLSFLSYEDADFVRTQPNDGQTGGVNFPFADRGNN